MGAIYSEPDARSSEVLLETVESQSIAIKRLKRIDRALPNAFPDQLGVIPNNPVIAATIAALLKGGPQARHLVGGWAADEDGRLCYRHRGKRGGEIRIYAKYAGSHRSLDDQWNAIADLCALSADTLLIILAQLCEPGVLNRTRFPQAEPIIISSGAIMRYKEMVRWGAERIAFQSQIAKQVEALARLRFDIVKFPAWDPKRKTWNPDGITLSGDRVIDIVDTACIGNKKKREETDDHFWSIRFGQWASSWVNAHGKVWLGPMPRQVITYDHRQNRASAVLAKKVAVNSVMLWGAARGRAFLDRRIDHLLESVGELPEPEQRGPHWAGRTFDRMSEAGLMLSESGVLKLTYEGGECVPQSFDRYKGWVKDWLGSKMRIERPAYFKSG